MKSQREKGFTFIEVVVAVTIVGIVMSGAMMLLVNVIKDWRFGESNFEVLYNCKESLNVLEKEIRESHGVEIIDPDDGWIKVYKADDKSKFTSFRIKNKKLFIGLNNMLNSNSEVARCVEKFNVSYVPEGITNPDEAKGIKLYLEFLFGPKKYQISTIIAFRTH